MKPIRGLFSVEVSSLTGTGTINEFSEGSFGFSVTGFGKIWRGIVLRSE
jgi:hypothetical protein